MSNKDDSTSASILSLLKNYKSQVDQREAMWKEGTKAFRDQHKAQEKEIERLKEAQTRRQASSTRSDDYKTKWEEAEAQCRRWEQRFQQLEDETIKPLQEKVDQLQRDYNQMKILRDRIAEICSSRQLTDVQLERLKSLVNGNDSTPFQIEPIANKTDFHQQTLKLRDMLIKGNDGLLKKIEDLISKKRKRDQSEDQSSDDDHQ